MFASGTSSTQDRLDAYKAKVRAFSGTGQAPDYTPPIVQEKLNVMYRKAEQTFGS